MTRKKKIESQYGGRYGTANTRNIVRQLNGKNHNIPDYTEGTKSFSWSLWFSAREFDDDISYGFLII